MQFEAFPKIPRFSRSILVTEKIDGTNAQVAIDHLNNPDVTLGAHAAVVIVDDINYVVFAGSRNRWITKEHDNYGFWRFVVDNGDELVRKLGIGRHFGEWWGQGIQRGYGLKEKRFSLFNTGRWSNDAVRPSCCSVVPLLAHAKGFDDKEAIDNALKALRDHGSFAAPGFMKPEGVVIFHVQSNQLFKKTLEGDDEPKSKYGQAASL